MVEENYGKRFLEVMETLAERYTEDGSRMRKLISNFSSTVHVVSDFHRDLRRDLKEADEAMKAFGRRSPSSSTWDRLSSGLGSLSGVEAWPTTVPEVLTRMKPRFLIYAVFVVRCKNLEDTIDLMKIDRLVKGEVALIHRRLLDDQMKARDYSMPTNFNHLLAMPMQHVLRSVVTNL